MTRPIPNTTSREALRQYLMQKQRGHERAAHEDRKRLREFDYVQSLPILRGLLDAAYRHRQPQPTSGLVELHQLLKRHEAQRECGSVDKSDIEKFDE